MRTIIRNGLIVSCYWLGIAKLRNHLERRRGRTITRIVTFHKIKDTKVFQRKIEFLARHFQIVSLTDFLANKVSSTEINVVLTFDDGYRSWLSALPVLEQHRMPAIFFVCSGYLDSVTQEQWETFCARGLKVGPEPSLGWKQLREIDQRDRFEVGGHTVHHLSLGETAKDDVIRSEIVKDKLRIEEAIGRPISLFSYPFGHPPSFNRKVASVVKEAGYECALTLVPGVNNECTEPFFLYRDCVDDLRTLLLMKAWLSGSYDPLKRMLLSLQNLTTGKQR